MYSCDFNFPAADVRLFIPDTDAALPVIYLHAQPDTAAEVFSLLKRPAVLAAADCRSWNDDLSPWPAARAFKSGEDFAGRAKEYLSELIRQIIPGVEATLPYSPVFRGIAGYSLAGLFALHSLYLTDVFTHCASMSGSLWYDDFIPFMEEHTPKVPPKRAYFSVGSRESRVRDPRIACVEECTRQAQQLLSLTGAKTTFELNPGNHFADVSLRIARGINWLLEEE